MNWDAIFIIGAIMLVFGMLLLFLGIPLGKLLVKKFPNTEFSKKVKLFELLLGLPLLILILLPKILLALSLNFSLFYFVSYGFGFIIYGVAVSLLWVGFLYVLIKMGYLITTGGSLTLRSRGTPQKRGAP